MAVEALRPAQFGLRLQSYSTCTVSINSGTVSVPSSEAERFEKLGPDDAPMMISDLGDTPWLSFQGFRMPTLPIDTWKTHPSKFKDPIRNDAQNPVRPLLLFPGVCTHAYLHACMHDIHYWPNVDEGTDASCTHTHTSYKIHAIHPYTYT